VGLGLFLFLARPVRAGNSSIFTVSAWVKPEGSVASKAIVAKAEELRMFTNASGYLGCQIKSISWQTAAQASSNALPLNTWSFVACTYDKANLKVFVNGVQVASQALTATVDDTTNALKYGIDDSASTPYGAFQGTIDEMKFYNYARTQKQIIEDMNAGHPAVGSPVGSPIAWYKFDEGYGTTVNNSGSGGMSLNGTLGTGSSAPSWTNEGKFGKALSFDGSNDYVNVGNNSLINPTTQITISGWFKLNSLNNNWAISKWKSGQCNSTTSSYLLAPNYPNQSSGRVYFFFCNKTGSDFLASTHQLNPKQWYHIIVTFNAGDVRLYINGQLNNSKTSTIKTLNSDSQNPLVFGQESTMTNIAPYDGLIDEVKIYNYALSEDEIKAEYNRGAAMVLGSLSDTSGLSGGTIASNSASAEYCVPGDTAYCAPPVARWDFEEGQGDTAYDTSGNGNNGSLGVGNSAPEWTTGKIGKALRFDGSNDYVDNTSVNYGDSYTIEVWINPNNLSIIDGFGRTIVASSPTPSYYYPIWLLVRGSQIRAYAYSNSTTSYYQDSNYNAIQTNNWFHVALTATKNNTARLYINGNLDSIFNAGPQNANTKLTAGDLRPGRGIAFQGTIDHLKLYNYARTPAQIAWDYNRGKPVAYYKFDECSGSIIRSTNDPYNPSLDATLTIGASGSQTSAGTCASGNSSDAWYNGATGKFNSSLNFDGTDDYAASNNIALIAAASQTYSNVSWGAWVKASSNQTNKTIIHKSSEFRLYTDSNGYPTCQVGDTGNTAAASSTLPNDTWSNLVCTYDGSNIKLYINGTLVASNSRTGTITSSSSTNINIAQKSDSTQRYAGQVDEVKIWNYALTSVLVENEYNQGAAIRFGPSEGAP